VAWDWGNLLACVRRSVSFGAAGVGVAMSDKSIPAFPMPSTVSNGQVFDCAQYGMSLRDYFAAHEKSCPPISWLQSKYGSHIDSITDLKGVDFAEALSKWRYQVADAMIAEREK